MIDRKCSHLTSKRARQKKGSAYSVFTNSSDTRFVEESAERGWKLLEHLVLRQLFFSRSPLWSFMSPYSCVIMSYSVFLLSSSQGIVGNLSSGKSALVHRYLTGTYVQEESPEGKSLLEEQGQEELSPSQSEVWLLLASLSRCLFPSQLVWNNIFTDEWSEVTWGLMMSPDDAFKSIQKPADC